VPAPPSPEPVKEARKPLSVVVVDTEASKASKPPPKEDKKPLLEKLLRSEARPAAAKAEPVAKQTEAKAQVADARPVAEQVPPAPGPSLASAPPASPVVQAQAVPAPQTPPVVQTVPAPPSPEPVKEASKPLSAVVDTEASKSSKPAKEEKKPLLEKLLRSEARPAAAKAEAKQVELPSRMEVADVPPQAPQTPPVVQTVPAPKPLEPPAAPVAEDTKKADVYPAVATEAPKSDVSLWTRMTGLHKTTSATPLPPPAPTPAPTTKATQAAAPSPNGPTGMASWNAAAVAPPAPGMTPVTSVSMPASSANAFTVMVPGGPAMQQMPMMMPESGVPVGMNNAFTMGSSGRPIPADMGRSYNVPNGLQGPGEMGGAERRPPLMPPMGYSYAPAGYSPLPQMPPAQAPQMPPAQAPQTSPAAAPSVVQTSLTVPQPQTIWALQALRDAVLPSEREMAVDQLRQCDWKNQPEVVEALTKAAKSDPAATVRAACVRALVRMKVNTVPVVAVLMAMKNDTDLRVRQEVEQALTVLMRP